MSVVLHHVWSSIIRHLELVSGSIGQHIPVVVEMRKRDRQCLKPAPGNAAKWTPKQVQGDGHLGRGL